MDVALTALAVAAGVVVVLLVLPRHLTDGLRGRWRTQRRRRASARRWQQRWHRHRSRS